MCIHSTACHFRISQSGLVSQSLDKERNREWEHYSVCLDSSLPVRNARVLVRFTWTSVVVVPIPRPPQALDLKPSSILLRNHYDMVVM